MRIRRVYHHFACARGTHRVYGGPRTGDNLRGDRSGTLLEGLSPGTTPVRIPSIYDASRVDRSSLHQDRKPDAPRGSGIFAACPPGGVAACCLSRENAVLVLLIIRTASTATLISAPATRASTTGQKYSAAAPACSAGILMPVKELCPITECLAHDGTRVAPPGRLVCS